MYGAFNDVYALATKKLNTVKFSGRRIYVLFSGDEKGKTVKIRCDPVTVKRSICTKATGHPPGKACSCAESEPGYLLTRTIRYSYGR